MPQHTLLLQLAKVPKANYLSTKMGAAKFLSLLLRGALPCLISRCVNCPPPLHHHRHHHIHTRAHPRVQVLADERLAFFYEGVDMEKLKNQQEKLMFLVFGGADLLQVWRGREGRLSHLCVFPQGEGPCREEGRVQRRKGLYEVGVWFTG